MSFLTYGKHHTNSKFIIIIDSTCHNLTLVVCVPQTNKYTYIQKYFRTYGCVEKIFKCVHHDNGLLLFSKSRFILMDLCLTTQKFLIANISVCSREATITLHLIKMSPFTEKLDVIDIFNGKL